jgi:hypothetical protein
MMNCPGRKVVCGHYPQLADTAGLADYGLSPRRDPERDAEAYREQFKLGLLAVFNMRALDAPDTRRMWTTHRDRCCDFLMSIGKRTELGMNPFLCAVLASGSIKYSGLFLMGQSISLGLAEHSGATLDPAAWRRVLESGKILAPCRVNIPMAPASPSRVIQDHGGW